MRKFNLSIHTKKELLKQKQSKIKGGELPMGCGCCCPTDNYGNTTSSMEGLRDEN